MALTYEDSEDQLPVATFHYQTFRGRREFSLSIDSAMILTTMSDSNSVTKDGQTVKMGGVYTGDETELARMGYK